MTDALLFRWLKRTVLTGATALTLAGLTVTGGMLPVHAQLITDPSPEQDSTGVEPDSPVSAVFQPLNGITINPATVKIFLNGSDVTSQSVITKDFFSYRPSNNLAPGKYEVVLQFTNSAGQTRRVGWTFTVGSTAKAEIAAVTHNAGNRPLVAGEVLAVTVKGTPSSKVTVFLIDDGQQLQRLPDPVEIKPGTYVSNALVQQKNSTKEGILVARLETGNQVRFSTAARPVRLIVGGRKGQQLTFTDTNAVVVTPVQPAGQLQPQVTNLKDGDRVSGSAFTLQGTSLPGAQVRIQVTANTSLGGIVSAQQTIVDQTVAADSKGIFTLTVRPLVVTAGSTYQINLTGTAGGQTSPTVSLKLVQQ